MIKNISGGNDIGSSKLAEQMHGSKLGAAIRA